MLEIIDVDKTILKGKLKEVTSSRIFKNNELHEEGIFSETIFGPMGSPMRRETFAYISLNSSIIHPLALKMIKRLDRKIYNMVLLNDVYTFDERTQKLVADDKGELTGFSGLKKLFNKYGYKFRGETKDRQVRIDYIRNNLSKIFINKIIILPAALREIVVDSKDPSRIKFIDPINEIYIKILNAVSKVKSTVSQSSQEFVSIIIQKLVNELFEYSMIKISKKTGIIRKNTLGKRTDFSARAVISSNPTLSPEFCLLPLKIAARIFEPHFLHLIIKNVLNEEESKKLESYIVPKYGTHVTAENVKSYLTAIHKSYIKDKEELEFLKGLFEKYIAEGRPVILKRDPVLHKQGIQGFMFRITLGDTIVLPSCAVGPLNADFDGDQMAVFTVLSEEAQKEVIEKMIIPSNPANINSSKLSIGQGFISGLYSLTKDPDTNITPKKGFSKEIINIEMGIKLAVDYDYNFNIPILIGTIKTTLGRQMIRSLLPDDYILEEKPIKGKAGVILLTDLVNKYGNHKGGEYISKLQSLCFRVTSIIGAGLTLNEFMGNDKINSLKAKLVKTKDRIIQQKIIDQIKDEVKIHIKEKNPKFYDLVESGAVRGWGQIASMLGVKGLVADAKGNISLVASNSGDGSTPTQYFEAGGPARKGLTDRAVNTATTGYLTRKLVYSLNAVQLSNKRDCKTPNYVKLKVTDDVVHRLKGRYYKDSEGKIVVIENPDELKNKIIDLRSPIYCIEPTGICHTCYGNLLEEIKTSDVGILAAQVIGERGTQLIMRCSDGLVASGGNVWAFRDLFSLFMRTSNSKPNKRYHEIKVVNFMVQGKAGDVKVYSITKHLPDDDVYLIETKTGQTLIVQNNHPLWIKSTPIIPGYNNRVVNLVNDDLYLYYDENKSRYITNNIIDTETIEVPVRDVKIGDAIWINTQQPEESNISNQAVFDGYLIAAVVNNILEDNDAIIREYLPNVNENILSRFKNNNIPIVKDGEFRNRFIGFAKKVREVLIDVNKPDLTRFNPDFLNYNIEMLKDFIAGMIDAHGDIQNANQSTICTINCKSYYLYQQIKLICEKLGYITSFNFSGNLFECRFRFKEDPKLNSVKLQNFKTFKVVSESTPKSILRGFDTIVKKTLLPNWDLPLYDLKTETNEFMLNGVQNHNSFHCFLGENISLVKINNSVKVLTLEEIYNIYNKNQLFKNDEIEVDDLQVWNVDHWSKVKKVIRHKKNPDTKMVAMGNNNGNIIISQDNHPHMVFEEDKLLGAVEVKDIQVKKHSLQIVPFPWGDQSISKEFDSDILINGLDSNFLNYDDISLLGIVKEVFAKGPVASFTSYKFLQQLCLILQKLNIDYELYIEQNNNIIYNVKCKAFKFTYNKSSREEKQIINYYQSLNMTDDIYVYDLATEDHTLTVNEIWTHNTGGTVQLNVVNFVDQLLVTNPDIPKQMLISIFKQTNELIEVMKPIQLVIDKLEYSKTDYLVTKQDNSIGVQLRFVNASMVYGKNKVDLFFNYPVVLKVSDVKEDDNFLTLTLNPKDKFVLEAASSDQNDKVKLLLNLIEKKNKIKNPFHLLMEIFKLYKDASDADLVHFEIVVCQVMRDSKNLKRPARLTNPYDGVVVGIKALPFYESWINGLLFENVNKALEVGLLEGGDKENSLTQLFQGKV